MAKRNQVTTELRISADAHLKSSRGFIKEMEKVADKLDVGSKLHGQLNKAIEQLKTYNKVLEKSRNKNVLSEEELKNLTKAGKEITNLITKTEKLYASFSQKELQSFSKEYVKQVKQQEAEIAKIKAEYAKKTGGNLDKDIANLDKYNTQIKEINKSIKNLNDNKNNKIAEIIKQENIKLKEQFDILQKVKKTEAEIKEQRKQTINKHSQETGFTAEELQLKNIKTDRKSVIKDVANQEYNKMVSVYNEIFKKYEQIINSGKSEKTIQKQLIQLAEEYNLKNIQTTEEFKERINLLNKEKNFYRSLHNREQLATEKAITDDIERRLRLIEAIENVNLDVELGTKNILQKNNFNSLQDLNNQKRNAKNTLSSSNVLLAATGASLTEDGENAIATQVANSTKEQTRQLATELNDIQNIVSQIKEFSGKLATQSERGIDEGDIKDMTDSVDNNLDNNKDGINKFTNTDNTRIAQLILKQNKIKELKDSPDNNQIYAAIDSLTAPQFMSEEVNEANKAVFKKSLDDVIFSLEDALSGKGSLDSIRENVQSFDSLIDELKIELDKELEERQKLAQNEIKHINNSNLSDRDKKRRINEINDSFDEDSKTFLSYYDTFKNIKGKIYDLENLFGQATDEVKTFSKEVMYSDDALNKAAVQSAYLGSTFDDIKNKIGYFLSLNYVFDQMTRKITEAVNTTKEMDKDMTQIGLVLNKTAGQVWKNFDTYSQMAERLNTTTSQVTNSMKLFYQQGLNTSEVNKMVEASAIAAALGESTMAEASETLTSIINSYSLSANEAMMVTDKISQIAIVSAADFGELSTAIEKVASSAASAGLDLDHMMGYLGKMIETTREAPTNIGTALKTIVANFTQFKEDPTQLNVEGSDINKVDKALKSVGIALTDTNGEVRDLGDVLDDLGKIWKNLNRSQKAYLATQIAGTRQQSRFYALMNDYDRTLELVAEGSNSAGKAQQQFALYSNSLEAAANRLTTQWEQFFNSITQGNGLIANFTNLLTGLMKIVNIIGPIGTVLGIGSFTKSTREAINTFNNLRTLIDTRKKRDNEKQDIFNDIKNNHSLTAQEKKNAYNKTRSDYMKANIKDVEKLNSSEIKYLNTIVKVEKEQEKLDLEFRNSSKFIDKTKYSINTLGNNSKKVWASMRLGISQIKTALASMATEFAIFAVISLAIKGVSAAFEGVKSALNLNTEAYIENAEKANENADNVNGLMLEYEELAKKVNKTAEEQERLKEITEEVTKIDSKLGQQLKDNVNNYEANVQAMKEYSDLQEKIAAQETARAIRSESSIGNNLFMLLKGDTWTNWFGSSNDKQQLKAEQQTNWRELAGARGIEHELTSAQTSMLNKYTEDLIKWQDEQEWDSLKYKFNTNEFDEIISSFIQNLKNLNEAQQLAYTNFITDLNSGDSTYFEILSQWKELNLPQEIKDNLATQLSEIMTSIRNQIDNNNYIQDKNAAYNNALNFLSVADANKLFNPNTSVMASDEIEIYKKDLAKFVESAELMEKYNDAQIQGGEALKDFSKELQKGGQYTQVFTDAIYSAGKTLSSEEFEKALSNLLKLGDLDINNIMTGEFSQVDILKELGKGTIDFKDLIISDNGTLSIGSSRLIAEQEDNFNKVFDTLEGILADRETQANNLIAEDNPAIAAMINSRDQLLTEARESTKVNANYEGGYQKNWQAYKMGWWDKKDLTSDFRNKSTSELEDFIQKNIHLEDNNLATAEIQSQIKGARYSLAEKSIDPNIIKNPNDMNDEEKNQYLKESLDLYNQEIQRVETLDKKSQDYYNSTYKISKLQETINETIDKGGILEEDKNKIVNEYNNQIETQKELNQAVSDELLKQINRDKERLELVKQQVKTNLNYQKGFAGFFDGLDMSNTLLAQIEGVKTAYQQLNEEIVDMDQLQQTLASNPALMQALDVTAEGLTWNKQKLEELGIAAIDESYNYIEARINDMEATKATLATQSEDISQWSEEAVTQTAAVIGGNNSLIDSQQKNAQNEATNLGISEQSWITWSDTVCKAIEAAGNQYNEFLKSEANKTQGNYQSGYNGSAQVGSGGGGKGAATVEDKKQDIAATLKATGYSSDRSGAIENINKQIEMLRGLQNSMKHRKTNIGNYLSGDLYDGSGGSDKFDPVIEKLEKFYNYLRQLEEIEARLNRIREKRNLIDASKNYYVEDLREENELLREQQSIYNDYIRDQGFYLAELRSQIQSEFGDWAYFNKDGVIQVRQTEFTANSEEEEEHLNNFLELVDLYQNEYNTREENINKLYEIENTQLENIKTLYEKILTRVQDINDELNRQVDLLDHDLTMSFENIAKYDIIDDKAIVAVEGIKTAQAYLNDFEEQVKSLNQEVKNGPFSELLLWDEALQIWRANEEALQNESIVAKYEAMGYAWQDIDTYIRSVATKSQSIRDAWKETEDSANAFAEQLKQLIDDRISAIQDFYGASTEELNKIFDSFEEKMTDIDNQNNLFGVAAASLEEKYLTLVTAVAVLKQTIGQLNNNRQSILDKIQEEYPEYITMINGVAIANKQAIEESNKLSEEQKAELLQLYGILEASEEQIGEMEDKLVDYFNTMLEMEQAKRDAIVELKQSVHDELIARDQEEIDNLRSKYDKMSQLDSEYYSELSQRVNDSRNLRENRQQASDISQMQARLAILKADNSGTYNAELIELQKQINTALQTQADNDINMELERIQREQQQREEDRQLTISAMENVLTFKDDNNWYWQEAQRIWDEGPESVTGFLRSSREYMNISDEQRAVEFENLTNNMNTAFSTLQTEAGLSDRISDGIVIGKSDEEQLKLDNVNNNLSVIQEKLGENGLAGKIDWANSQNMLKLDTLMSTERENAQFISDKMQLLYTEKIGPGTDSVRAAIVKYLDKNSSIWGKLNETDTALDNGLKNIDTGFSKAVEAASKAATTITDCINAAKEEYLETDTRLYQWLNDKYAKDNADKTTVTSGSASTKAPTTSGNGNSGSSAGGNGSGSSAASQPSLAIGSTVSVKPGTRWYYDSYGTNPSGVARGGKITYTNLKGSHPYNIEGLGWIKKTDIVGYSKGGYVDYTGVANVHGTQREPEAFLNAKQTRLFEMLRDGLVRTTSKTYEKPTNTETNKQEYNIDNLSIEVKELADVDSIEKVTKRVKEEIYKDSIGHNNMAVRRR